MTNHEQTLEQRIGNLEQLVQLHQRALEDVSELITTLYDIHRHEARELLSRPVRQRERDQI